jgi:hypothetical protein
MKKYSIQVREKGTGKVIETIQRILRSEQIGNFCPMFCTYKGNTRCLVQSDAGDLSDPFRREESYETSLFIEVPPAQ